MNVLVLGGAGELGANFSKLCIDRGYNVTVIDITRKLEAWRLRELGILDQIKYVWLSTFDLLRSDVANYDLILDCACQADRPLGTTSPKHTLYNNLMGPLNLLEAVKGLHSKPFLIYPSSGVEFLGVPKSEQPITEATIPKPTNVYGYSKWMAEELYQTYRRCYSVHAMIVRTGSCYGPMMRTDQFIAQCIIKCLKNEKISVYSPEATRTFTYLKDVQNFYKLLLDRFEADVASIRDWDGLIIYNSGNAENRPYSMIETANLIKQVTQSESEIVEAEYELGEMVNGVPVYQWEKSVVAKSLLGWKPQFSFKEGLEATVEWWRSKS